MTSTEVLAQGEEAVDDILEHHGIKGMRWGVRRNKDSSASGAHVGNVSNLVVSEDHARATEVRTKIKTGGGTKAVSNKELQELVTRMNLEQQYSKLATQNRDTLNKGHAQVRKILGFAKTAQEVHSFVTSPLVKSIKTALDQK